MSEAGLRYAYKPSLAGAPSEFELGPDALHWQIGRRAGQIQYDRVRAVRMAFRPVTLQSSRFVTDIRADDNPNIRIISVSWRGPANQERLDEDYRAFIVELHRRLAGAGVDVRLTAGLPVVAYWIGAILFGTVMIAVALLALRAWQVGQSGAPAVIGLFFAVFAVQLGDFFRRNRPQIYRPEALPEAVMPRGRGGP
jgi:hypothetical protein